MESGDSIDVDVCDEMSDGALLCSRWHRVILDELDLGHVRQLVERECAILEHDAGRTFTWFRLIGHRKDPS